MSFDIDMIRQAEERIRNYVIETLMIRARNLDRYLGCKVWLKAECMQKTGSFKLRGAMNMIRCLTPDQLKNGIVTASSGNHGRACAYAAKALGIPAVVVVPDTSAPIKIEAIRELGAEVVLCKAVDRFRVAGDICRDRSAFFIPPYDDERIMAGQGTVGIEMIRQLPNADAIVVPTSGGGLLSGVVTAVKALSSATVIGAEPALIPRYTASLAAGHPVEVPQQVSIADALVSNHPGEKCFEVIKDQIDGIATVTDEYILKAQRLLLMEGKIFTEPSACTGVGAVLQGTLSFSEQSNVCFLLSGGNCSIQQLSIL